VGESSSRNSEEAALLQPGEFTELLDEIRAPTSGGQLGLAQAEAGETIPLDDL